MRSKVDQYRDSILLAIENLDKLPEPPSFKNAEILADGTLHIMRSMLSPKEASEFADWIQEMYDGYWRIHQLSEEDLG